MSLLLACCRVQLLLSWSRCLIPRVRGQRCLAIIRGFLRRDTIAGVADVVGTRLDAVFLILQRLMDADFPAVEIGFYAQCWSCFSELDVFWSEPLLFIFKRQNELRKSRAGADVTHSDIFFFRYNLVTSEWLAVETTEVSGWNIVTLSAQWPTSSKGT